MVFLVDAQLPPALCTWLAEQGFEAMHVSDRLGGQMPDAQIGAYAVEHQAVLVTKDDDFALRFPPQEYQLVWLRCGTSATVHFASGFCTLAAAPREAFSGRGVDRSALTRLSR